MSWQRIGGLAWTESREDGVIQVATFPETKVYSLTGGASVIWQYLDEPIDRDELLARIAEGAGLSPTDIADDVDQCLMQLSGLGLAEDR